MKNLICLTTITILLLSCNNFSKEKFKTLSIDETYKNISGTPKEIMQRYYPFQIGENTEGNQTLDISVIEFDDGWRQVILIHDNMLDDSQKGIKIEMVMKRKDLKKNTWEVTSIQKNWKCRKGRGHENWGVSLCS